MKNKMKKGLAGIIVMFSFVPMLVLAENTTTPLKTEKGFCARITTLSTKIVTQITNSEDKQERVHNEKEDKFIRKTGEVDIKRAQNRADIDGNRAKRWDKMLDKANTDAEKAAVTAYKTAIQDAATARRTAVDLAVETYRTGATASMTARDTAVKTAMEAFKVSVNSALTAAQSSCASGTTNQTVSSAFNKSVNDARKTLREAKKTADITSGIASLKQTRDEAIKLADTTFKTATTTALANLKLVLHK